MKSNKIIEFFGLSTRSGERTDWNKIVSCQICPFTDSKCFKVRKSQPDISIGSCSVRYGKAEKDIIICPNRLLERHQVFIDCLHLLTLHEPGNELHILPEISVPGGSIDYFLASAKNKKIKDFTAIEFQTLDTTGTAWPERQRFLEAAGIETGDDATDSKKSFGMNWKMTTKTILMQLHHKIETFEHFNKHLVLVLQDHLFGYMGGEFDFTSLHTPARIGDSMHIHSYSLNQKNKAFRIELDSRFSTDAAGIARCMGLQAEAKVDLERMISELEKKISDNTLLKL